MNYWYLTTHYFCPVCGSGETTRERMYTPKPIEMSDRHKTVEHYDYCLEGV